MTPLCEHNFAYLGLVYDHAEWNLSGSGAKARYYYDRFFCTKCAETIDKNKREHENSYYKPLAGATPR